LMKVWPAACAKFVSGESGTWPARRSGFWAKTTFDTDGTIGADQEDPDRAPNGAIAMFEID